MSKPRLTVRKLGLGDFTADGAFYPCIDGTAWGESGRAFWPTRAEAMRVGIRLLDKLRESEKARSDLAEQAQELDMGYDARPAG